MVALRTAAALTAGKAARLAARLRGGGSAWPGLVTERIDPAVLRHTLADLPRGVVVISGTNGKTTTTRMVVALLRAHGLRVFTNPTGSNFTRGVISELLAQVSPTGRLEADIAVLELDEAHALKFAAEVAPTHTLLLNVARDQLDRFAEIDHTARLLETLALQTTDSVVLNADDSFVSRIAAEIGEDVAVRWFGLAPSISHRLPELQEADSRAPGARQAQVPPAEQRDALLEPVDERDFVIRRPELGSAASGEASDSDIGGGSDSGSPTDIGPVRLNQRGLAAMINATAATALTSSLLGAEFRTDITEVALRQMTPPFGRGETIEIDGYPLELVLVKNPAGFTVALGTYGSAQGDDPVATMVAINDNYADGRDVSWLYDVSFESLREHGVALTSGVRGYDMALRLAYDGVPVDEVIPDLDAALEALLSRHAGQPRRIFCTYTAMMHLRRRLAARYGLARFGEESG